MGGGWGQLAARLEVVLGAVGVIAAGHLVALRALGPRGLRAKRAPPNSALHHDPLRLRQLLHGPPPLPVDVHAAAVVAVEVRSLHLGDVRFARILQHPLLAAAVLVGSPGPLLLALAFSLTRRLAHLAFLGASNRATL